jgi:hypothetical protein
MTIDGMRVWDIRRALQTLRQQFPNLKSLTIRAGKNTEFLVLLAALYEPPANQLLLPNIAPTLENQPSILNLTRTLPIDLLPLLVAQHTELLTESSPADTPFTKTILDSSQWTGKQIRFTGSDQK